MPLTDEKPFQASETQAAGTLFWGKNQSRAVCQATSGQKQKNKSIPSVVPVENVVGEISPEGARSK